MQNLAPLAGPRVAEAARRALTEVFGTWARALSAAFSKYATSDGSLPVRLGARNLSLYVHAVLFCHAFCGATLPYKRTMHSCPGISRGPIPFAPPSCPPKGQCLCLRGSGTLLTGVLVHAAPATEPAMETAASLVEQFLPELAAPLMDRSADLATDDQTTTIWLDGPCMHCYARGLLTDCKVSWEAVVSTPCRCGGVCDVGELMLAIDALAADLGMQRAEPPEEDQ